MKTHTIIALNDGETWSMLQGCSICVISDDDMKALQSGEIEVKDVTPVSEIYLGEGY